MQTQYLIIVLFPTLASDTIQFSNSQKIVFPKLKLLKPTINFSINNEYT